MRKLAGILATTIPALAVFSAIMFTVNIQRAVGMRAWSVSSDVGTVPQRPDISLQPLPSNSMTVSADTAVAAVKAVWGLQDGQIQAVVSASLSKQGDALHQQKLAWIVVANQDIPALGTPGLVFHKLVSVVDGATGRYVWAYCADETVSS